MFQPSSNPADDPLAGLNPKELLKQGLADDPRCAPTEIPLANGRFTPLSVEDLNALLPQFEVLEMVGQGGMGAVYKARQSALDRLIAIKILPPLVGRDPAFAERFSREAKALARLNHPHIVSIHDAGGVNLPHSEDKLYYFVMEFVDGVSLRQVIRDGKLPPEAALAIVPQVCEALQYAHDVGIVHRDIKPDNILLDQRGRVKIADFGLAKLLGQDSPDVTLTGTNQVMGTLRYMAPEQMSGGKSIDHRADIYSLGVVFYEMLTGEVPMGRFAPPSKKVQVDIRLDEIVLRALEQDPQQRYQQASEVKTEVEGISRRQRPLPQSSSPPQETNTRRELISREPTMLAGWLIAALLATSLLIGHILFFGGAFFDSLRGFDGKLVELGKRSGTGSTTRSVQLSVVLLGMMILGGVVAAWVTWLHRRAIRCAGQMTDPHERAAGLVRGPAIGLILMGVVNLLMVFLVFVVLHGARIFGDAPFRVLDFLALFFYIWWGWMAIGLIQGGMRMLAMESLAEARELAQVSLLWPNLNFLCLVPISLWATTVLNRREVQEAFSRTGDTAKTDDEMKPPVNDVSGLTPLTQVRFLVDERQDIARQANFHFSTLGYQLTEQSPECCVFQRGGLWAGLWEFNLRNIFTRLTVRTIPAPEQKLWVSCDWSMRQLGNWVTKKDIRQLEAESEGLRALLGVALSPEAPAVEQHIRRNPRGWGRLLKLALIAIVLSTGIWCFLNRSQSVVYPVWGNTGFVDGPQGLEMGRPLIAKLGIPPQQVAAANEIFRDYLKRYTALERRHTTQTTSADGHIQITIEPFVDEMHALATDLQKELRGVVDQRIAPPLPAKGMVHASLPIFRQAGEALLKVELWKADDGQYHWKQEAEWVNGGSGATGHSGPKSTIFPPEYLLYWSEAK